MTRNKEDWIDAAEQYVCPNRVDVFRQLGTVPVMGRREGHYFWDMDGRKLFDVHINGGVYNLGHRNPELVEELKRGLDELDMGNHHFVSPARTQLAEALIQSIPGDMGYAVFSPSGSEAVEVCIRTARHATGRRKIISFDGAYHGHGGLALRAGYGDQAAFFLSDRPGDEFIRVPFNDIPALEAALARGDVAAVLCEMIPATQGFPMPDADYYPRVKALCERHGSLFIADEVQTGLGRTGRMWACETFGVVPDLLVTGKGLTGGLYPIAAAVMSRAVGGWLREDGWGYSSTAGGSELGCRVGLKVLEIIGREGVLDQVGEMSKVLGRGLKGIQSRHAALTQVRQCGLVHGLVFNHSQGGAIMAACGFNTGLWAFPAGFDRSVLQFKPGLLIDSGECANLLGLLEDAICQYEELLEGAS
ncbi:MAG: aminotransferase class III-fold pyridoxal phosphate-dependent enzyme [Desulfobacterales bacterium]|nr:aminotransferase class III-fold pyridoxal phosphate-dependent enzyme [Desulfobacterales bacterium]